uniref:Uncharacterized protein n=1 Tax=Ditylenchus dipsaci TaxID=166011 RepID=A0A915DR13_9BILA
MCEHKQQILKPVNLNFEDLKISTFERYSSVKQSTGESKLALSPNVTGAATSFAVTMHWIATTQKCGSDEEKKESQMTNHEIFRVKCAKAYARALPTLWAPLLVGHSQGRRSESELSPTHSLQTNYVPFEESLIFQRSAPNFDKELKSSALLHVYLIYAASLDDYRNNIRHFLVSDWFAKLNEAENPNC